MAATLKINWQDFDPSRLVKSSVETKQSKPRFDPSNPAKPPESVSYGTMPIKYAYPTTNQRGEACEIVDVLCVEGPVLYSPVGITKKTQSADVESASLYTTFDLRDEEVASFVSDGSDGKPPGFWETLYRACYDRLWEVKPNVPALGKITKKDHLEGIFPYPIFWQHDSQTGHILKGKNPCKYFNLLSYGKPGSVGRRETLFTIPVKDETNPALDQYQRFEWAELENVEMKFKPLIRFRQIFIGGGKASIQFEIVSAVVLDVVKANTQSAQRDTLDRFAADTSRVATLQAQVAALRGLKAARPAAEKKEENETPIKLAAVMGSQGRCLGLENKEETPAAEASPLPIPAEASPAPTGLRPVGLAAVLGGQPRRLNTNTPA